MRRINFQGISKSCLSDDELLARVQEAEQQKIERKKLINKMLQMRRKGLSYREIATLYGLSHQTVSNFLQKVEERKKRDYKPTDGNGKREREGYMTVFVGKDYPGAARNGGWVMEHRLIMAQHLGRFLEPWEIVHHINRNKKDNRIENLRLTVASEHPICQACPYYNYYIKNNPGKTP